MVHFDKSNLMNLDVLKNVVAITIVAYVLTRNFVDAAWLGLVEYLIHILVIA